MMIQINSETSIINILKHKINWTELKLSEEESTIRINDADGTVFTLYFKDKNDALEEYTKFTAELS